jgi:hypothetical protein
MYKQTHRGDIIRLSDSAVIPRCEVNTDYREFLEWLAAGNTLPPADPVPALDAQSDSSIKDMLRELTERVGRLERKKG